MEVTFVNVGYGDAILVGNDGLWGLVDGGSGMPQEFTGNRISLRSYLAQRNITRLEFVIITHIHEDHVCGLLDIIPDVQIGEFHAPYLPVLPSRDDDDFGTGLPENIAGYIAALNAYRKLFFHAEDHQVPFRDLMEISAMHPLGPEVGFSIVEPSVQQVRDYTRRLEQLFVETDPERRYALLEALERDSNDASVFVRIGYQGVSFLLTADNCPRNWRNSTFSLLENENVLKLPHHGQIDAVNETMLKHLKSKFVVTSSSSDRRHNSSSRVVYEKLKEARKDVRLCFTDEIGYESFSTTDRQTLDAISFSVMDNKIAVTT